MAAEDGTLPAANVRPPLEFMLQGEVWLVKPYTPDRAGETYSTHDSHMDALGAAKRKMEDDNHPCILRWESPDSVRDLYWNLLFEELEVKYDQLLEAWTIVPEEATTAIDAAQSRQDAYDSAKGIQFDYNFKHLRVYDDSDDEIVSRDHRFLRHDITDAGVRFDPSKVNRPSSSDAPALEDDEEEETDEEKGPLHPSNSNLIGASLPDVTDIEVIESGSVFSRYATPWHDGGDAEVLAVSQDHADDSNVREAFKTYLKRWRAFDQHPAISSVHEYGGDPVPWVAFETSDRQLASMGTDLSVKGRLTVIYQIGITINQIMSESEDPVCGLTPANVYITKGGSDKPVTIAELGIEWAIKRVADAFEPTPYTAPEQIDSRLTETTAVYQLGALAYYLLCESPPIADEADPASTIKAGDIPPADPVDPLDSDIGTVIDRALQPDPDDRHDSVKKFCKLLREGI